MPPEEGSPRSSPTATNGPPSPEPDESRLATCRFDLDGCLRFSGGTILLTDRRLISDPPGFLSAESGTRTAADGVSWQLSKGMQMDVVMRAAVGRAELLHEGTLLARWYFTPARAAGMHGLADALHAQLGRYGPDARSPLEAASPGPFPQRSTDSRSDFEEEPERTGSLEALVRVVSFARSHLAVVLLGGLLSLAGTAAALVPPYLTMPLIDRVLIPSQSGMPVPFAAVWPYLGGLAVAALLAALLAWARTWTLAWVSERIAAEVRVRTYAHMQSLSLDFFASHRTGDLISRVGSDSERINYYLSVNLIDFSSNCLMVALTAGVLVWLHPLLAAVTLVPFPLVVWLVYAVRARLRGGFARSRIAAADMTSVLADTIPGIRVVKAFAQEDREIDRFAAANARVLDANDRVNVVWSYFGPLVTLFTELGLLVIWAAGAWLVFGGSVTVGTLTAFLAYIGRFYARVESMIRMVPATQQAAASAQRICDILDCRPTVAEAPRPVRPARIEGRIQLRDVRFRYATREVLRGISLTIEPGEMIGLVGTSGSGKSTLANLICRFYDPSAGTILVDGISLRDLGIVEYRRHLGCVLQEPFLFYGSIAENIAYGRPTATPAEIVAAARAAGAHEFILGLPSGYDSRVGERGSGLSGGERQRISIARALLVDPRILILDEATSSVDAATESVIQTAIDRLVEGRTTIAIAHRLSTLRRADRLVVLEAGSVVEIGTHDQLLAADGVYARLYRAQMLATELTHAV
jgi:ATP-binding cassette subfamily B protein